MKQQRLAFFLFCILISTTNYAQKIATFEVQLDKPTNGLHVPAKADLDAATFLPDSVLSLVEVRGRGKLRVTTPYQIETTDRRVLHWLVDPAADNATKRVYELVMAAPVHSATIIAKNDSGALTIRSGNKNLLRYFYKTAYPPAKIDTNFKRSGFIHPLWTPHGQELTRIQPPDHYHHYGIWNAWTHVYFEKDTVDFWNIKGHQGTVRFAKFISVSEGPVYSEYQALHEHVVFKKRRYGKSGIK